MSKYENLLLRSSPENVLHLKSFHLPLGFHLVSCLTKFSHGVYHHNVPKCFTAKKINNKPKQKENYRNATRVFEFLVNVTSRGST